MHLAYSGIDGELNIMAKEEQVDGVVRSNIENGLLKSSSDLLNIPGRLLNIQTFTSSGTYIPTDGTKKIKVTLTGGGASGGRQTSTDFYARSGGAGGTRIAFIDVPTTEGVPITIGLGGEPTSESGGVGNPGGDSLFGSIMTANGGTTEAKGGSSSGSGFGIDGGNGNGGGVSANNTIGGVSFWGGGGAFSIHNSGLTDLNGRAYGSGGAGCSNSEEHSGSGMSGICVIEEYS